MSDLLRVDKRHGAKPSRIEPDLRSIVDSVPGLLAYLNRDCQLQFANRRFIEWFQRPQDSFIGMSVAEILGSEDFERVKPSIDLAFAGETTSFERYHSYDGRSLRYVKTTLVPDFGFDGYVKGLIVLVEDISDRKRAEDAEKNLERQLTLLIEASGSLLISPETADVLRNVLDVAKRFIEADAYSVWRKGSTAWTIAASHGLSADYDPVAPNVVELNDSNPIVIEDVELHPTSTSRRATYKREGIKSFITIPLSINNQIDGTLVFYYRSKRHFSDLEIKLSSALGNLAAAAIGSADSYQRQSQLRQIAEANEQRAAFLAEAGQILASSLDFDQTLSTIVDLAVPGFADLASVEIIEPSGETRRVALKHCSPEKLEFVKDFRNRFPPLASDMARVALETGKSHLLEDLPDDLLVQRARSPEHLEALRYLGFKSIILAPLKVNNRVFGLMAFVTGDSGRHYSPADLAFAEELARRAATAMDNARLFTESAQAQTALRSANAKLSSANEDLNQFAYSASHDLQEPLRMLTIYSQLLDRKYGQLLDGQAHDYLGYIVDGAKRMEMLLSDLLAYMQVVNISEQNVAPVDPNKVIDKVLTTLSVAISESGAKVECDEFPPLKVQEFHLVQLFQNLISNAIKYRGENPPHVRITCNREIDEWKICVQDNGIGIPAEYRNQVFKLFKRLHDKNKYPGTGIGLSICHKIVERYGGRIWIEAGEEGLGTTICITLAA